VVTDEATVPLIVPVLDRVSPEGNVDPLTRVQEKGPPEPVAVKVCWYMAFCVANGRVGKVAIESAVAATPLPLRLAPWSGREL